MRSMSPRSRSCRRAASQVAEHELQKAGEVVQVLADVPDIADLGGLGERGTGDAPDPGGAVDGELADVAGAAADAFCLHQIGEHVRGLEGGDVAYSDLRLAQPTPARGLLCLFDTLHGVP